MHESPNPVPPDCGGRFAIQSFLGAGGMGSVWSAYDHTRQSRVAIKVMRDASAGWLYHFKNEFRSLAGTAHPNLVTLHELIEWQDEWLFTMELVPGVPFHGSFPGADSGGSNPLGGDPNGGGSAPSWSDGRIAPSGASEIPAPDLIRFSDALRQLCDGLDFLHGLGLAHGDVKPANALITPEGRVVILDFGIVRDWRADEITDQHPFIGTPAYLSPECLFGSPSNPASDMYAVGVILFEGLTGRDFEIGIDAASALRRSRMAGTGAADEARLALEELCLRLIDADRDRRPSAAAVRDAVVSPFARVAGRVPARAARRFETLPFVAREREIDAIRRALSDTTPPAPRVVIVSGESGIGKSALTRRVVAEQLPDRTLVLEGKCYEREHVAFRALDRIVDALSTLLIDVEEVDLATLDVADLDALARMFPVLRRVPAIAARCGRGGAQDAREARDQRHAAARVLGRLMMLAADGRRLVLYIDDLHWGDEESATLLRDLLAAARSADVRLLGCQRETESAAGFVSRLLEADPPITHLHVPVGGLSPTESEELVRSLLGPLASPEHVTRVASEAHGSPFLIRELVEYAAGLAPSELGLRSAIAHHIDLLPASARNVLEVVAVAGRRLEIDLAREAAAVGETFEASVILLRSQHLIAATDLHGDEIEPYHDRIRGLILQGIEAERLVARHAGLARALEGRGHPDPARLGLHLEGAGQRARAAEALWQAAQVAEASLAPLNAAGHYAKVAELTDERDPRHRLALVAQARTLRVAGHVAAAGPLYLRLAEDAEPAEALLFRRNAAEAWVYSGEFDRARRMLGRVLEAGGVREPRTWIGTVVGIARNLVWLRLRGDRFSPVREQEVAPDRLVRIDAWENAAELWSTIDLLRSFLAQTSEVRESLIVGEPRRVARALVERTTMVGIRGAPVEREASALLARAARAAEMGDFAEEQALIDYGRAMLAVLNGRYTDVVAAGEALAHALILNRATRQLRTLRSVVGYARWWLGQWDTMVDECDAWMRDAIERGDPLSECGFRMEQASQWMPLLADQPERVADEVVRVRGSAIGERLSFNHLAAQQTLAWTALYQGRADDAERVLRVRGGARAFLRVQRTRVEIALLHAFAALAAGPRGRSRARSWLRRIERERLGWIAPLIRLIEASLAAQVGRHDDGIRHLEEAITGMDRLDYAMFSAAASWRLGCLLGGAEGEAMRGAAAERIAAQGAKRPDRIVRMLAPGFGDAVG